MAQYYYYPGWWEGGAMLHTMVNLAKWDELPPAYQAIVKTACQAANCDMMAKLRRQEPDGAQAAWWPMARVLRPFPQDVMEACFNAAKETYAEISATQRGVQEDP